MKTFLMAATALMGASVLGTGLAAPAEAQTYRTAPHQEASRYEQCVAEQRQRQIAGAVIGGVLGAVVGAELHDESQDRARERGYRDPHGRYRHYDRYDRYDHYRDRRYRHREQGNDGAVVAGGAVGALAGAAIAGGDCERYRRHDRYGYDARYGNDPYRQGSYGGHDPYYGDDPYYDRDARYGNDPYYDDPYYGQSDSRRYSTRDGDLLGGPGYGEAPARETRRYESDPGIMTAGTYGSANCRTMTSAGRATYMCQGSDGIWRPAQSGR